MRTSYHHKTTHLILYNRYLVLIRNDLVIIIFTEIFCFIPRSMIPSSGNKQISPELTGIQRKMEAVFRTGCLWIFPVIFDRFLLKRKGNHWKHPVWNTASVFRYFSAGIDLYFFTCVTTI